LLNNGKAAKIKGFKSRTYKTFNVALQFNETCQIKFIFDDKKENGKGKKRKRVK